MRSIFILSICILLSCNSVKPLVDQAAVTSESDISGEMNKFLLAFEKAVAKHQISNLIDFIDVDYKVEQLGNLEGNLKQFINELFCGNEKDGDRFICLKLEEIESIRLVEMIQRDESNFEAMYEVRSKDSTVLVSWEIHKAENNMIAKYGFVGAYG